MILILKAEFSSAHLYNQPLWSDAENQKVFGACFSKWGHGHNYTLEVGLEDPGLEEKRKIFKNLIQSLAAELHDKHLNYEITAFQEQNPTTENLCLYFSKKIQDSPESPRLHFVKVYETECLGSEIYYE